VRPHHSSTRALSSVALRAGDLNPRNVLLKGSSKLIIEQEEKQPSQAESHPDAGVRVRYSHLARGFDVKLSDFGLDIKMRKSGAHINTLPPGSQFYMSPVRRAPRLRAHACIPPAPGEVQILRASATCVCISCLRTWSQHPRAAPSGAACRHCRWRQHRGALPRALLG
jgi:hypothetical protein